MWSYVSALKWPRMWYGRDDLSSAQHELGLVQSKRSRPMFTGDQVRWNRRNTPTVLEKFCTCKYPASENHVNIRGYILSVCRDLCCDVISLYTSSHRTRTCTRLMASSADPTAAAKGYSYPEGTADSKSKVQPGIIMVSLTELKTGRHYNAFGLHLMWSMTKIQPLGYHFRCSCVINM